MSVHLIQHKLNKEFVHCTYKKKTLPIGFVDNHLAHNVAKRIAYDPQKLNVRLKVRNISPINSEEYVFEDEINEKLRCLSRDINSSVIMDREFKRAHDPHPWDIESVDEKVFYSFPFDPHYDGIALCHDIDDAYLESHDDFVKKIIALKTIIILFDTPTISQLNRLFLK